MEKALRYELSQIPELQNRIFPTHSPEGHPSPYLVYIKSTYRPLKTFEGIQKDVESTYLLNVLADSYETLDRLVESVKTSLKSFPLRSIGSTGIYIKDLTINNLADTYENELNLYRNIIDVTFYYREV